MKRFIKSFYYKLKYFPRVKASIFYIEGNFVLGKNSVISRGSIVIVSKRAELLIGTNTYIGEYANIRTDSKIQIGCNCKIAQFVTIVDADYDFHHIPYSMKNRKISEVKVGDNVFVGSNSVILRGSNIPSNRIIPALSTIKKC